MVGAKSRKFSVEEYMYCYFLEQHIGLFTMFEGKWLFVGLAFTLAPGSG